MVALISKRIAFISATPETVGDVFIGTSHRTILES
jgi:hypothetical protein